MPEYLDNPAGRLLAVVQAARSVNPGVNALAGWQEVLNAPPGDHALFHSRVAQLFYLAGETRRTVESFPDEDPETILEHFPQVEATLEQFNRVAATNMQGFFAGLEIKSGDYSLRLCSSLLHRRAREAVIKSETVRDLQARIETLIQDVVDAGDLANALKEWTLDRLKEILEALRLQPLYGYQGFEESALKLIGGMVGKRDHAAGFSSSKVKAGIVGLIMALDTVLNIGANVHELTAGNNPPPSPVVVVIQQQIGVSAGTPELPPNGTKGDPVSH